MVCANQMSRVVQLIQDFKFNEDQVDLLQNKKIHNILGYNFSENTNLNQILETLNGKKWKSKIKNNMIEFIKTTEELNEIESLFTSTGQNSESDVEKDKYETDEEENINDARELASKLNVNDRVLYAKPGEPERLATICEITYDDKKPYYSLKLEDGNIRESEHTYIKRIQLIE